MRLHYHFDVPEDKKVRVVVDTDAKTRRMISLRLYKQFLHQNSAWKEL